MSLETVALKSQVIIVGAGPAGVGTSIYLSKAGIPHIIIERDVFPRDKVCGDACSGKTAFVLRKANPAWLPDIYRQSNKYLPSHGIIFAAPNGKQLRIPYGENNKPGELAPGFTAPRLVFDNFLFEKLDTNFATVFQAATIKSIERTQSGVSVIFEQGGKSLQANAPLIIGADGDKGICRKTLLQDQHEAKANAVGLRAYYEGIEGLDAQNFIELHFLREILPGYLWIFPLSAGMANVGIAAISSEIRKRKINLRETMLRAIATSATIAHRFEHAKLHGKILGWGLPLANKQWPASGERFMLAGDAASLVDPFSGEGIGNALYSGMLAANTAVACHEKARFDAPFIKETYDKALYRRLGDEFRISLTMQRLCRLPWLFDMVVNKAHKSPALCNTISCMFTDIDLRAQLRKPSFYFNVLFNR